MADQSSTSHSGVQPLRPKARILRTFGDELISSEIVALIELVKNAYDADATKVLIKFHAPFVEKKGGIEVIDNGHGMSLDTIQTTWMEPATSYKKKVSRSEHFQRRVLGEKGIGRFAASRLANFLDVITRRVGVYLEIHVKFDWELFDDDQKYLDQVNAYWDETEPVEICPGGTIEELWIHENGIPGSDDLTHGSILRMNGYRSIWDAKKIAALRTSLSRLISPFPSENLNTENAEFKVYLQIPEPFEGLSGTIDPPEVIKYPHYTLEGSVDESGNYTVTLQLRIRSSDPVSATASDKIVLKGEHSPQCGPFTIKLLVWNRDELGEIGEKLGQRIPSIRGDLDSLCGVNIYRDGFRVLPYGEPGDDWLGLDARRVDNPTLRFSNNQILGYIFISADSNKNLRDQSNREGILAGSAFADLREMVLNIFGILETRRYALRHPPEDSTLVRRAGIFADFNLENLREVIQKKYPHDAEIAVLLGEKEKDLETRVKEVQIVLARYRRLATMGQLIDMMLHDGRTPLGKLRNVAQLGLRDIQRSKDQDKLITSLQERLQHINMQAEILNTVFRRIEPFGGRKRGQPTSISIDDSIANAFAVFSSEFSEVGARFAIHGNKVWLFADESEIQEIIINLLQNSLYWLRYSPKPKREITVTTEKTNTDEIEIIFSDSGPGVADKDRAYIFDPYYSAKSDGIGLGLTIVGEIVHEYYSGQLELLESGPLPGATFRIILHRRN